MGILRKRCRVKFSQTPTVRSRALGARVSTQEAARVHAKCWETTEAMIGVLLTMRKLRYGKEDCRGKDGQRHGGEHEVRRIRMSTRRDT